MESRLSAVMASAWDYAPPAVVVVTPDEADEEKEEPTPPCASAWSPSIYNHRWLVAALSLLFLYWVWSEDRPATAAVAASGARRSAVGRRNHRPLRCRTP